MTKPPSTDWTPGKQRKVIIAVCCPECGSDRLRFHGCRGLVRHCRCLVCRHQFKDIHDQAVRRVMAV